MSLIRDALNKAQQEQDAARSGRPAPRFTPSYSRPNSSNGPAAKIFGGLIALGAVMGGAALFLQLFYPMSRLAEKEEAKPTTTEAPKSANVAVRLTPPKTAPNTNPPTPPVSFYSPPEKVAPTPAEPAKPVPAIPAVAAPTVSPAVPTPPPVTVAATIPAAPQVVPVPPPAPTPAPAALEPVKTSTLAEPNQQLVEFVDALSIRAVMVRPDGSRVSVGGRIFQSGDFLPGAPKPLRLSEITKDSLTFKDNAGNSYTKRL